MIGWEVYRKLTGLIEKDSSEDTYQETDTRRTKICLLFIKILSW